MEEHMASKHDTRKQEGKQQFSRRRYLKWVGQVAAGFSLAGIGFGINAANSSNAFAATDIPAIPNCVYCPPYGTYCCDSCASQPNCYGGYQYSKFYYTGACVGYHCLTYVGCSVCTSQNCPQKC
jgi:hypothetical protein